MNRIREVSDLVQSRIYCLTLSCTRIFFLRTCVFMIFYFNLHIMPFFLLSNECEFFFNTSSVHDFFWFDWKFDCKVDVVVFSDPPLHPTECTTICSHKIQARTHEEPGRSLTIWIMHICG